MARCETLISRRLCDLRLVRSRAFTLIELLVVVAIISILSAIAVPNFLEAQTRAKVSRVKNDQRTIVTALEAYALDYNKYPPRTPGGALVSIARKMGSVGERPRDVSRLTTPISYLTTYPIDVFENRLAPPYNLIEYWDSLIMYELGKNFSSVDQPAPEKEWHGGRWGLASVGPDGVMGQENQDQGGTTPLLPGWNEFRYSWYHEYDPTNGTVSGGNVYRFQKDVPSVKAFGP